MRLATRSSRPLAGAATLTGVAALAGSALLAAGCGAGGGAAGAITVGEAPPPAAQLARVSALAAPADALQAGPGPARVRVMRSGYAVTVRIVPNLATTANRLSVSVSRDGAPVPGARVRATAGMLTMDMGVAQYRLDGTGAYSVRTPAWLMPGRWRLAFSIAPPGHAAVRVVIDDSMRG